MQPQVFCVACSFFIGVLRVDIAPMLGFSLLLVCVPQVKRARSSGGKFPFLQRNVCFPSDGKYRQEVPCSHYAQRELWAW